MSDTWDLVHAERHALLRDLEDLTPAQWEQASGCEDWTIHDVVAHLVANAQTTPLGLVGDLVRAGFDFDAQNEEAVEDVKRPTPEETLQEFKESADNTDGPPLPLASRLVEEIVHGEDIRRPLGIVRQYPMNAVTAALQYQLNTPDGIGGARSMTKRVRLIATDTQFEEGQGPTVTGPAIELLLLATGRAKASTHLHGAVSDAINN